MKHKIQTIIILMGFIILCIKPVLSTEAADVNIPPTPKNQQFATVTKGKVNKHKLKKDSILKYNLTIKDKWIEKAGSDEYSQSEFSDCKDLRVVVLVWQSSKKQKIYRRYSGKYNEKKRQFKISDKIKISKGVQQGKWKLSAIIICSVDVVNYEDEIDYLYIYNSDIKWNDEVYSYSYGKNEFVDLSFADFTVSGTGKKLDKKGPSISTKSLKLSKKELKKGYKSKFSVKVNDKSGMIYSATCRWVCYGSDIYGDDGDYTTYEMKYNKKKKVYECEIFVDSYEYKAKLRQICLMDCYGNTNYYYWKKDDNGKERVGSSDYSITKKDKKAIKSMMIKRKKKYIEEV